MITIICVVIMLLFGKIFNIDILSSIDKNLFELKETDFHYAPSTWEKVFCLSLTKNDTLGRNVMQSLKEINEDYYDHIIKKGLDISTIDNYDYHHSTKVKELTRELDYLDSQKDNITKE